MTRLWTTDSPEETERLGRALAGALHAGDVVLLAGALGVGKTTLVKGAAAGLGVTGAVKSPTFALHLIHNAELPLHHIDLYRLERPQEVEELGLDEVLGGDGVCFVEWPERMPTVPDYALGVTLEEGPGPNDRHITLHGPREIMERVTRALNQSGFAEAAP